MFRELEVLVPVFHILWYLMWSRQSRFGNFHTNELGKSDPRVLGLCNSESGATILSPDWLMLVAERCSQWA